MKLRLGVLMGAVLLFCLPKPALAQAPHVDPVLAAEEAQKQAQFQFENQLADLNTSANSAKEQLLSQRNGLNRELQQCFIQKNESGIQAQQQADQSTQQATQQLVQGGLQTLPSIFEGFGSTNAQGKEAAKAQREAAVQDQHLAVDLFAKNCKQTSVERLRFTGNADTDASIMSSISRQARPFVINSDPTSPTCAQAATNLISTSNQAKRDIDTAKQADSAGNANLAKMALAAGALGMNYWGYQNAKEGAEEGLKNSDRINALNYDSCTSGIKDQAAEIDRQLANIDRQLASDRDRLAKQFAQFKVNIPAGLTNKPLLNVDTSDDPSVIPGGGVGVAGTQFNSPSNPLNNLLNKNGGGGGGGAGSGAGGGGAGLGGGGDDGKVGWGFRDPYETNNPGLAYTLPQQPDKAGLIGGADGGGEFAAGGTNPFGDGFMGFEDPFANMNGAGAGAALAAGAGGNGFIELAMKSRRIIYKHLPELLGQPTGTAVSNKPEAPKAERKISSVRD